MKRKRSIDFPLTGENEKIEKEVSESNLLLDWMDSLDDSIKIESIKIQTIKRDSNGAIGYLKLDTVNTRNGGKIPRIIMLEGASIIILVILNSIETNKKYCLLTERVHIATGKTLCSLPFKKVKCYAPTTEAASKFLKRNCSLETDLSKFRHLIREVTKYRFNQIYPYCGPCNNKTHIFLYETNLPTSEIMELDGKEPKPNIFNRVVEFENAVSKLHDFISLSAFLYYSKYYEMCEKENNQ